METVKVVRWLKQAGDKVAMGEPLVELETDKATMEVESPADATLEAVLGAEGDDLSVGAVLARLRTSGETTFAIETKSMETSAAVGHAMARASPTSQSSGQDPGQRILASPFVRRLAKMNGADLARLAAATPFRRIRGRDVIAAAEARDAKGKLSAPSSTGFEPFSSARRQIAEAVSLSRKTIPSFVIDRWVETAAVEQARGHLSQATDQAAGVKLTLTDFFLLALAESMFAHPRILDRWHEDNGRGGRLRVSSVDIGLVVALSDGIMIPVLRDLAGKSIDEVALARHKAVRRARMGRLLQADLAPVSFSLSNIGGSGADRFEAVIYPGQSGILAVGRQHERVIARAGGIAVAKGVNLAFPGSPSDRRTPWRTIHRDSSGWNAGRGRPADQIYVCRFAPAPSLRAWRSIRAMSVARAST
jgi:pyruvate dehydrogenase E2 component (dihydrolipoamide acetyltransferase)